MVAMDKNSNIGEYMTTAQVAGMLGFARVTLEMWRNGKSKDCAPKQKGPPFIKLGRRVIYRRSDVNTWIEGNRVDPSKA